ncbi:MAG: glycosyltransferase family 87 protein [Syntrophobacteraceae bacterium]
MMSRDKRYATGVALAWVLPFAVVAAMVAADPSGHTVTPVYHRAVEAWWAGKSLYLGTNFGYFYFPQFAIFFTPFSLLPVWVGDNLWRLVSIGLLAWGTWRLLARLQWPDPEKAFLLVSILTILPSLGALRNGQANLIFAAVLVHATVFLAEERWTAASLCLTGLLIIKPIALAPLLLAPVAYRKLLKTLPVFLAVFLAFPFLFGNADYVFTQYRQLLDRLLTFSVTHNHIFADINGLLRTLGVYLPGGASQLLRMLTGVIALGLWIFAARRNPEPGRALVLLALAATYLMLFNPMTEVNSYAIVAPAVALFAVYYIEVEGRMALGWWLVFADLSISLFPEVFRFLDRNFGLWWDPLMMLAGGGLLATGILRNTVFTEKFSLHG